MPAPNSSVLPLETTGGIIMLVLLLVLLAIVVILVLVLAICIYARMHSKPKDINSSTNGDKCTVMCEMKTTTKRGEVQMKVAYKDASEILDTVEKLMINAINDTDGGATPQDNIKELCDNNVIKDLHSVRTDKIVMDDSSSVQESSSFHDNFSRMFPTAYRVWEQKTQPN